MEVRKELGATAKNRSACANCKDGGRCVVLLMIRKVTLAVSSNKISAGVWPRNRGDRPQQVTTSKQHFLYLKCSCVNMPDLHCAIHTVLQHASGI